MTASRFHFSIFYSAYLFNVVDYCKSVMFCGLTCDVSTLKRTPSLSQGTRAMAIELNRVFDRLRIHRSRRSTRQPLRPLGAAQAHTHATRSFSLSRVPRVRTMLTRATDVRLSFRFLRGNARTSRGPASSLFVFVSTATRDRNLSHDELGPMCP